MERRTARVTSALGAVAVATLLGSGVGLTAQSPPGSTLRVWLVTAGPGDAVWERYGHNAIRVLDTETGRDVSYNWGVFDFQQVDFIPRFLQGRMLYRMATFPTQPMVDAYARADREVVMQELAMTPAQRALLRNEAERNALPENAEYIYQYFLDNCSTRARDLLDRALGGLISQRFGDEPAAVSFRDHTRTLSAADPLIAAGMDALLGAPTDRPISMWEEMFLPMKLQEAVRELTVEGPDGTRVPLVLHEEIVVPSSRPAEEAAGSPAPAHLLVGLLLGGLMGLPALRSGGGSRAVRVAAAGIGAGWSALAGVLGTILLLLLFTDHTFAYRNENLFLFTPLSLAMVPLAPMALRADVWRRRAATLSIVIVALATLGLIAQTLPMMDHRNAIFFAVALPPHLGLAAGLLAPRARRRADEAGQGRPDEGT